MADSTAKSLQESARETTQAILLVEKIAQAAQDEATAIMQVDQGVELISSVVQTNAATAEQSAAASEELSGQSSILKELIFKFKLRETEHTYF